MASSVLPTPEGPDEDERAHGAVGVLQAAAALRRIALEIALTASSWLTTACAARPRAEQPLDSSFSEARQRHAGHLGDDLGDDLLVDDAVDFVGLFSRHSCWICSFSLRSFSALSRSSAARS